MSDDKRDSTKDLIAHGEALRSKDGGAKKPPRTKQLVRDAERLIGREPLANGVGTLLKLALAAALIALALGATFLFWA